MMLFLRYILFALVMSSITGLVHYYFYRRLVKNTELENPWRNVAVVIIVFLAISLPLGMILGRTLPFRTARHFIFIPYTWMGMMLLLFMFLLIVDFLRLIKSLVSRLRARRPGPGSKSRRIRLMRLQAAACIVLSVILASWSVYSGRARPELTEVNVTLERLPVQMNGFRIVQLTDMHIGSVLGREWVSMLVESVNSVKPDLVVLTGDIVDGDVTHLSGEIEPLSRLKAAHGVYIVTGNHEYYSGISKWTPVFRKMNIKLLRNERVAIGDGKNSFDLAGIDDYNSRGHAPGHGPDLEKALKGRDPDRELILLAHQPKAVYEASKYDVGLQLSGHTHGGQICPWGFMVLMTQPYLSGLHLYNGRTQIYVSEGSGMWGPPMRLGTNSEITLIRLLSGKRK